MDTNWEETAMARKGGGREASGAGHLKVLFNSREGERKDCRGNMKFEESRVKGLSENFSLFSRSDSAG